MYAVRIFALLVVVATAQGYISSSQRQTMGSKGANWQQPAGEGRTVQEQRMVEILQQEWEAAEAEPKRYYYDSTLTWESSAIFCDRLEGRALCSYDELCPKIDGVRQFIDFVIPGDHWVPVVGHDWLEIGTAHGVPCILNSRSGHAKWEEVSESHPSKGYVYCCKPKKEVGYRYIGGAATYASSKKACTDMGRRLCHSSEVCVGGEPVHGVVNGDYWIAVSDADNDWTQIGNSMHSPCTNHAKFGKPWWGNRSNGKVMKMLGYVYCCEK